jgi:hypothetical protein
VDGIFSREDVREPTVYQRSSGVRSRCSPHVGHCFLSISRPWALGRVIRPSEIRPSATGGTSALQIGHEYLPTPNRCPSPHPVNTARRSYDLSKPSVHASMIYSSPAFSPSATLSRRRGRGYRT